MTDQRRGVLLAIAFVVLWTLVELAAARLVSAYTAYQVVWFRYGVHLAVMLAWWAWRGDASSLLRTRRPAFQLARSALMFVMPISWFVGTKAGVPISITMAIFWIAPLWAMAAAAWWLRERVSPLTWAIALAAGAGAVIAHLPISLPPRLWMLLAPLAMGLSFALYLVMTRSLRDEPVRANLFYSALGVFVLLTPVQPFVWITPGLKDLLRLGAVGSLGLLGLVVLDRMVAAAPVSITAPVCFLQVSLTIVLGLALQQGTVSAVTVAALGLTSLPLVLLVTSRSAQSATRDRA